MKHALNQVGFVVNEDLTIDQLTYQDFLDSFYRRRQLSVEGVDEIKDEDGDTIQDGGFQVWELGSTGRKPYGIIFKTFDEANEYLYASKEWSISRDEMHTTCFHLSFDDAKDEAIELISSKYSIDKEVAASIYSKILKIEAKKQQIKNEIEQKRISRNAEAAAEAAKIIPDAQFINDLKGILNNPDEFFGAKKSEALHQVTSQLLERSGYGKIKSDFWKVFRILKKKALK